jgi:hypothetical protein
MFLPASKIKITYREAKQNFVEMYNGNYRRLLKFLKENQISGNKYPIINQKLKNVT